MHAFRLKARPCAHGNSPFAALAAVSLAALVALAPLEASATGQPGAEPPATTPAPEAPTKPQKPEMTMDDFLDRLMIAESGGRDTAKNPLSTATGAFQFI